MVGAPKQRVREVRASAYRALVLDAAERVFGRAGYEGAKIKDIADEAGLALGTVYTIYPSKHDVFIAVHERRGGAMVRSLVEVAAAHDAPLDAIAAAVAGACAFYADHPDYLRMHLHRGTSWAAPRLDVAEEVAVYRAGRAPLEAWFTRAGTSDAVDPSPATLASLFLAGVQVLLAEWLDDGLTTPHAEVAARCGRLLRRLVSSTP